MQQCQQGASAPEKQLPSGPVGTRVRDEFGPAIAVARERSGGLEGKRRASAIEPLDQAVPGEVETQVFGLVDDARAVLESDDPHRTPIIVRIGEIALDLDDFEDGARVVYKPKD